MQRHESSLDLTLLLVVLALFVSGGLFDLLVLDEEVDLLSFHALFEISLLLVGVGLLVSLGRVQVRNHREIRRLQRDLVASAQERDRWRANAQGALSSMAVAIDQQFDDWGLTPAEREVALALLKGHSHKAIAAKSQRSAQTVRSHAAAIYAKAGLGSRAELSAFFLEDLDLPESKLS